MTTTAPASLVGLVEGLTSEGVLPEQWRAAFLAVPREVFIPEVIWRPVGEDLVPLCRPRIQMSGCVGSYGPRYVVTQVDDGTPAGPGGRGRVATSSASRPDIVALMLEAGQIQPVMRVLEISRSIRFSRNGLGSR